MKPHRKMRIAVDMDETIVDTLSRHIAWYNKEFDVRLCKEALRAKKIVDAVPAAHVNRVKSYPEDPAFFAGLSSFENAIDVLRQLSSVYEIFIATAAMEYPTSFSAKYHWLVENLPFISPLHFVFCGDKSVIHADYLIDDSPRHLDDFCGQGILFDAPHNRAAEGYVRVSDWLEVKHIFLETGPDSLSRFR